MRLTYVISIAQLMETTILLKTRSVHDSAACARNCEQWSHACGQTHLVWIFFLDYIFLFLFIWLVSFAYSAKEMLCNTNCMYM